MCLPALAIGAILAAAGGVAQYAGQKKADHALSRTFNREHARQQAFQADQQAAFQDSLDSTGRIASPDAQTAAAANREAALLAATKSADPAASGYLPSNGSAPQIVATAGERAGAKSTAATSGLAKALASMGGFGDIMQQNDINIAHNGQKIGQIGGFMRGSLDALQPEMDAAKQKGSTLRTLGGLAQSIGQAVMMGGGGIGGMPKMPVAMSAAPIGYSGPSLAALANALPGMAI